MRARDRSGASGEQPAAVRFGSVPTVRRRVAGFLVALLVGPLLLWLLGRLHTSESIATEVLSFQLLVVVVALIGGIWPALFAAVFSSVALDLFFIEPHLTVAVSDPVHALTLLLHVIIAVLVSYVVGRAERQTQNARRAAADSELLQAVAGSVLHGQDAVQALLDRTREAFALERLRLVANGSVIAESGGESGRSGGAAGAEGGPRHDVHPVDDETSLEVRGPEPNASQRRLLKVVTAQLAAVLERRRLEEAVSEIEPIAASDRVRGALLSALSHDLRRPLAAATAAVGGLRAAGSNLSPADQRELLDTAEESLGALTVLVSDLLDVSRVQAGALVISPVPVDPADVIVPALDECDADSAGVELVLELASERAAAQALADPVLLQRALANLLANAIRFSPRGAEVRVSEATTADRVEIRVVDHGPGIPAERRDEIFVPFQRLGDTDNTTGLGLGLALARGFVEAMDGALEPERTPGGGLTMVVSLPRADRAAQGGAS